MSTRSAVASPAGDSWRARYVHSDGYVSHMLPTLLALVARDGVDEVLRKITVERFGWSSLDPATESIEGVKPDQDAAYGTAGYLAHAHSSGGMYGDGRFAVEPGYGVAYTTVAGQSSEDEWITPEGSDWGTEFAYVLYPKHITILANVYEDEWRVLGTHRYDKPLTPKALAKLEG